MRKPPENTLASRLKELRLDKGITQRQLAAEIGVSYGAIVGYENGRREPNSKAMAALERYFGVSGEFLRGELDRDIFMANSEANQQELDQAILAMKRFKAEFGISDQAEQALAAAALTKSINLICTHVLHRNLPVELTLDEIMGPFSAIFHLNAAGRAELNKRADELQQLAQYKK